MTDSTLHLPCYISPTAGPKALIGKLGLAIKRLPGYPFPIRCQFYGLLNGEGDSRRSTISINYAEHELIVCGPEGEA